MVNKKMFKNPQNEIYRVNDPCGNYSKFCSEGLYDDTDSCFVFKFHGNRELGSG